MTACTAQLTDFSPAYNAAQHPHERRRTERRRTWTIRSITLGMVAVVSLLACMFAGHSPDPSRCEPDSAQTIITRPVSPDTFTLDECPPGVKYTIR
jgi:hypothetical protein